MNRSRVPAANLIILTASLDLGLLQQRVLEYEGFGVIVPASREEAFQQLASQSFDVAVVSHSLDREDAAALVKRFRLRNPHGRVLAITLSGAAPTAFRVDETVAGLEGPEKLVQAIRELLNSRPAQATGAPVPEA
ncbi:MAG: hypothetical protein ACR2IF_00250 [Terriglobales bacterium]